MSAPNEVNKIKKFRKTQKGTKEVRQKNKKSKKPSCHLTKKPLSGVAVGSRVKVRKLSKSARRPSVPFGGVLGSEARREIFAEAIKVKIGLKKTKDVSFKSKNYIKSVLNKLSD